jgi:hypothetical protein
VGADPVVIRSYPKGVFLYPCLLVSILAAILASALGQTPEGFSALPGKIFIVVFAINILVLAWDFSRTSFIVTILTGVIAILLVVLLEREHDFMGDISRFLHGIQLRAHPHFYLCFAAIFAFVLVLAFVQTRLDYWEVHGNELLHVTGFVKNVERFPSPSLTFRKTVPDVFEYCLLGSGTLTLEPAPGERHVLTNVLMVGGIERKLEALLSTLEVTIDQEPKPAPPPPPGT